MNRVFRWAALALMIPWLIGCSDPVAPGPIHVGGHWLFAVAPTPPEPPPPPVDWPIGFSPPICIHCGEIWSLDVVQGGEVLIGSMIVLRAYNATGYSVQGSVDVEGSVVLYLASVHGQYGRNYVLTGEVTPDLRAMQLVRDDGLVMRFVRQP